MERPRRLLAEIIAVVLFGLIVFGLWKWTAWRQADAIAEQSAVHERRLAEVVQERDRLLNEMAHTQGELVLRAFAAGLRPAILAERRVDIDGAIEDLIGIADVTFVHVLRPDGAVIASSDRKLTATGHADERAAWALGVSAPISRQGMLPGTVESAMPIGGAEEGVVAIVWLAYESGGGSSANREPAATAPPETI